MRTPRGGCRPLQPTRPTPSRHRRQAIPPAGFGLLPVRSPLLRESSLFLGVLRCFSSPGALFGIAPKVPGRAPGGLPHSEIPGSLAASASPGHFAAWPRPSSAANAKASTMRPSCGCPPPSPDSPQRADAPSARRFALSEPHRPDRRRGERRTEPARASRDETSRPAPSPAPPRRPQQSPDRGRIRPVASRPRLARGPVLPSGQLLLEAASLRGRCSCVCVFCVQCARATRHEPASPVPLPVPARGSGARWPKGLAISRGRRTPRVPRGALSRYRERAPPLTTGVPAVRGSPSVRSSTS